LGRKKTGVGGCGLVVYGPFGPQKQEFRGKWKRDPSHRYGVRKKIRFVAKKEKKSLVQEVLRRSKTARAILAAEKGLGKVGRKKRAVGGVTKEKMERGELDVRRGTSETAKRVSLAANGGGPSGVRYFWPGTGKVEYHIKGACSG